MNCEDCGYELDDGPILVNQHVHKLSRSTRCCNERIYALYGATGCGCLGQNNGIRTYAKEAN